MKTTAIVTVMSYNKDDYERMQKKTETTLVKGILETLRKRWIE